MPSFQASFSCFLRSSGASCKASIGNCAYDTRASVQPTSCGVSLVAADKTSKPMAFVDVKLLLGP